MTLLPINLDYTDRDFESVRLRLISLVQSVFPTWTDTAVANWANHLLEAYAWIGDVLEFYQDQQARETRWGTAQLRQSMIALVKLIDYTLPGATAAIATVRVTVTNAAQLVGTIVPATPSTPVVVRTDALTAVRGELRSPAFAIPVGTGYQDFTWEHSLTQPPVSMVASGLADQRVELPLGPYLEGSAAVQTTSQGAFSAVSSFVDSGPSDLHYRVEVDQNDRATIVFGDGVTGALPLGTIRVDYRTGGGLAGNVAAGTLTRVEGAYVDDRGQPAYLTATNALAAAGGTPREEVDGARVHAPASLRALTRSVTVDDFETHAMAVAGVGRVLMLTSNELATIGENRGNIYVVPDNGGTPSPALLSAVETAVTVTYPTMATFQVDIIPAVYLTVDVRAVVFLTTGAAASTVRAALQAALAAWFAPTLASGAPNPTVDFGARYRTADDVPAAEIAWTDLLNVVRDTAGVRKVSTAADGFTLNTLRADLPLALWEFPALGEVTLINGDTGAVL